MKIKHSKFRNTGLIFELLVKQVAADTLNNKDSAAINIMKTHFAGRTTLSKEFKLYEFIVKNKNVSQSKAEAIVSTITEVSRKLNHKTLKDQKYALISDIKESYNSEEFFGMQVRDYKPLAALYCLLEAQNNTDLVDPQMLIDNKTTILEHLTSAPQKEDDVKDTLIEEYSKYDKDLKLLTFKILLEKFNDKYKDLLPEQKNILKEFITSVNSQKRLRTLINKELTNISKDVLELANRVKDKVVKIKLDEVSKSIKTLPNTEKIKDSHLVNLMQYYDLVNELRCL
jgi:hypothetical protein|tara:strand:+ start:375 stop:1229 length:855 start_codon:yes stop_codon:yes gene_type:complete